MISRNIVFFLSIALTLLSCTEFDDDQIEVVTENVTYYYQCNINAEGYFSSIVKSDTNGNKLLQVEYGFTDSSIIKSVENGDGQIIRTHHYVLDTSGLASRSVDTLFSTPIEVRNLTYNRGENGKVLKSIITKQFTVQDGVNSDIVSSTLNVSFTGSNLDYTGQVLEGTDCRDHYFYIEDTAAVYDIYDFRDEYLHTFDGKITGLKSSDLLLAVQLNAKCVDGDSFAREVFFAYADLNTDKTVSQMLLTNYPERKRNASEINVTEEMHIFNYTFK